jgi:hypothetical protein
MSKQPSIENRLYCSRSRSQKNSDGKVSTGHTLSRFTF